MIKIPLGHGLEALVDDSELDLLLCYSWHLSGKYASAKIDGKETQLHLLIAKRIWSKIPDQVDHEDRNKLNCIRANLRLATRSENAQNKETENLYFRGVKKQKSGSFFASLKVNQKCIYLGTFETPQEAALAYDCAAVKYFGEFAILNFSEKK